MVTPLSACEVELKEAFVAHAPLVRLGDIATITGLEPQDRAALERLVIAPSPTPSGSRTVTPTQLRYWLMQYGVETAKCRMTGARRVLILGKSAALPGEPLAVPGSEPQLASETPPRFDLNAVKQCVSEVVLKRLAADGVKTADWSVDVDLPRRALWTLPHNWNEVRVDGLRAADAGSQEVTVQFASREEVASVPLTIHLQRSEPVVVAVKQLVPGDVVGEHDVALQPLGSSRGSVTAARDLAAVVGREVKRAIGAGTVVETTAVQAPLLVRRRDTVVVEARSGGITVRRHAIASQNGALGDVITFESPGRRNERFMAQVTGYRTAAVFVSAPTIMPSTGRGSQ